MNLEEIYKSAENEASWLKYYGHRDSRMSEEFKDETFYDRLVSIGYAKVNMPLPSRCVMICISSERPVMNSSVDELFYKPSPRNHNDNIYTPLEYVIGTKQEGYKDLIKIIKK